MLTRFLTAFALLGVGVFVIIKGGLWMWVWALFVALICAYELFRMSFKTFQLKHEIFSYSLIILLFTSALSNSTSPLWLSWPLQLLVVFIFAISIWELYDRRLLFTHSKLSITLRTTLSIGLLFPYIYLLRAHENGLLYFFYTLFLIWACDSLALLGGRQFGKSLLSRISPNKTIEGSVIGFFSSLFFGVIFIFLFNLPILKFIIIACFIGAWSQVGDLHESLVKRQFKVKDSSNILPGHGGFYDRADSTMFVVPVVYFLVNGIL